MLELRVRLGAVVRCSVPYDLRNLGDRWGGIEFRTRMHIELNWKRAVQVEGDHASCKLWKIFTPEFNMGIRIGGVACGSSLAYQRIGEVVRLTCVSFKLPHYCWRGTCREAVMWLGCRRASTCGRRIAADHSGPQSNFRRHIFNVASPSHCLITTHRSPSHHCNQT